MRARAARSPRVRGSRRSLRGGSAGSERGERPHARQLERRGGRADPIGASTTRRTCNVRRRLARPNRRRTPELSMYSTSVRSTTTVVSLLLIASKIAASTDAALARSISPAIATRRSRPAPDMVHGRAHQRRAPFPIVLRMVTVVPSGRWSMSAASLTARMIVRPRPRFEPRGGRQRARVADRRGRPRAACARGG